MRIRVSTEIRTPVYRIGTGAYEFEAESIEHLGQVTVRIDPQGEHAAIILDALAHPYAHFLNVHIKVEEVKDADTLTH